MPDNTVTLTCMRCGTIWQKTLAELRTAYRTAYKGNNSTPRVETFSVPCPGCGLHAVAEVKTKGGRDG